MTTPSLCANVLIYFVKPDSRMGIATMNWTEICAHPLLGELPFKIQTDQWGHIVMSPATNERGMYQAKIAALLSRLLVHGVVITECAIQTREGVKVADAAWASDQFIANHRGENPFQEAPQLCVEILSPSNTMMEMDEKKELYFSRGAREVWVCDKTGTLRSTKTPARSKTAKLPIIFPIQC
jgi:Uma2 family endonuclease